MPFRHWFEARGYQHPVAYSMAMLSIGVVLCMAVAVTISVQASRRAVATSLAQERERMDRQREVSREASCVTIRTMIEVYSDPVPVTVTGRNARKAWADLGEIFRCE